MERISILLDHHPLARDQTVASIRQMHQQMQASMMPATPILDSSRLKQPPRQTRSNGNETKRYSRIKMSPGRCVAYPLLLNVLLMIAIIQLNTVDANLHQIGSQRVVREPALGTLQFRGGAISRSKSGRRLQQDGSKKAASAARSKHAGSKQRRWLSVKTGTKSSNSNINNSSSYKSSSNSGASVGNKSKNKAEGQARKDSTKDDPKILFLIRLMFLTYYGSLGSLLPYLPVYYHSLGHGGQIIGLIGAIKPFTTFLVAPFWGIVSDQSGNPFVVLYFTFLISLVGQLMVSWRHDPTYIMTMVFITAFFNAPVKSLLDSMVMANLQDRSQYGRLRLWGQLGFGIGSSGVGILLSKSKHRAYNPQLDETTIQRILNFWQSLTGYKLLFLTYAVLSIPTWFCIRAFHQMQVENGSKQLQQQGGLLATNKNQKGANNSSSDSNSNSKPKKEATTVGIWDGISIVFHNSDAVLFFFLVFVVGVSSGVIENFAYVRIREVGGTGRDMGLSRLISSAAGAPMFWFSGPLTTMLGADRVIVLSLASYVLRFIIYAFMKHPYHGLPAEALRGVTFAAFWSTGTIYASKIAPPGMGATMLMFLNAMYGGLGQSLGAIIGGKLQSKLGTVQTFLCAASFDLCFVGFVIAYLFFRREQSNFRNPTAILPRKTVRSEAGASRKKL